MQILVGAVVITGYRTSLLLSPPCLQLEYQERPRTKPSSDLKNKGVFSRVSYQGQLQQKDEKRWLFQNGRIALTTKGNLLCLRGSERSPCSWRGIACNEFRSSGLRGTLHAFSFSSFPSLLSLDLSHNSFYGHISSGIANLSSLINLDLSRNQLAGILPSELGLMTSLHVLYLHDNGINGSIPQEIGSLSSLQKLGLGRNSLTGPIPASLWKLGNLSALYLYQNKLTGTVQ